MNVPEHIGGIDVIPPKEPQTIAFELSPEEIELALATGGESVRKRVVMALILAMINTPMRT